MTAPVVTWILKNLLPLKILGGACTRGDGEGKAKCARRKE